MNLPVIVNSLIYAGLGIIILILSFIVIDMLTPGKMWHEIMDKQNRALAQLAGSAAIGISIIIAAAIHG